MPDALRPRGLERRSVTPGIIRVLVGIIITVAVVIIMVVVAKLCGPLPTSPRPSSPIFTEQPF